MRALRGEVNERSILFRGWIRMSRERMSRGERGQGGRKRGKTQREEIGSLENLAPKRSQIRCGQKKARLQHKQHKTRRKRETTTTKHDKNSDYTRI